VIGRPPGLAEYARLPGAEAAGPADWRDSVPAFVERLEDFAHAFDRQLEACPLGFLARRLGKEHDARAAGRGQLLADCAIHDGRGRAAILAANLVVEAEETVVSRIDAHAGLQDDPEGDRDDAVDLAGRRASVDRPGNDRLLSRADAGKGPAGPLIVAGVIPGSDEPVLFTERVC